MDMGKEGTVVSAKKDTQKGKYMTFKSGKTILKV